MVFEIPVVIDGTVLDKLVSRDKYSKFLIFYIQSLNSKIVTPKSVWNEFTRKWENELPQGDIKDGFFNFFRGAVRPYRKEGYDEYPEKSTIVDELKSEVNRDYDSVNFLIVNDPSLYKGDSVKIGDDFIVNLKGFFTYHEVRRTPIYQQFDRLMKCE